MEAKSVTLTEFCRITGKDKGYISRLVKQGRMPRNPDGTFPVTECVRALSCIPQRVRRPKPKPTSPVPSPVPPAAPKPEEPAIRAVPATRRPKDEPPPESPADDDEEMPSGDGDLGAKLTQAKIVAQQVKTKIDRLELAERKRELIRMEDAEAYIGWAHAEFRSRLLALPQRLSGSLEGRGAREIEGILETELNEVLRGIQKIRLDGKAGSDD